ncbi:MULTISPECIES: WGR domain-containing protein [Sandaracinus]|uniref:WGR domain-containing protein n=1 Tax=Sandaracinus TaxID=1055688 RepID=UPI0019D489ED|nr:MULTISPECIES: WGR domain-containing protein [Sandaracinus]UJR87342.1 WGR domain-containing protein [Sandaracinus amylolyticus]
MRDELVSVDADRNRFRFFVIELREVPMGGAELVRRWGRVGAEGRCEVEAFDSLAAASVARTALLERRKQRGYIAADPVAIALVRRMMAARRAARRSPRQLAFPGF